MQNIICPNCKAEVDSNLSSCPKCGALLTQSKGDGVTLSNSYPSEKPNQVNQQHVAQAILNEGKKKDNPKAAMAVGVIFVLAVIAILLVLILASASQNNNSNNDSNNAVAASTVNSSSVESSIVQSSLDESSTVSSESIVSAESAITSQENSNTNTAVITVEKPDDWSDIYCYIYTKDTEMLKNAEWPGELLSEHDGNKYNYQLSDNLTDKECYVIFSTTKREDGAKAQFPFMNDEGFNLSDKHDFTVSDFTNYANDFKNRNG